MITLEQDKHNQLYFEHQGLIYDIASKFYGIEFDDLIQAGSMGLIKAAKAYNDDGKAKFSTYAREWIYGEMYTLISKTHPFKPSKDNLRLYKEIIKCHQFLCQKQEKIPTTTDLAAFMQLDEELIIQTIAMMGTVQSMNALTNENGDLYNCVPSTNMHSIEQKLIIDESYQVLNEIEATIIDQHYFKDRTQAEIAQELGLTQVAVSRCVKKSLNKMQAFLTN